MSPQAFRRFIRHHRPQLAFLVGIVIVIEWSRHVRSHPLTSLDDPEHIGGLLLFASGVLLRSWAAGIIRKGRDLATEGPYSLIRHPLHAGALLMWLGFTGILEDRFALALILMAIPLIYLNVIRGEEHGLADRFGDEWLRYKDKIPGLIPRRIRPVPGGEWRWEQWWSNREWRVIFWTAVMLPVLELWNAVSAGGL